MKTAEKIWVVKAPDRDDLSYLSLVDKNLADRQATGRRWARSYDYKTKQHTEGEEFEYYNTPFSGADVFKSVSRYRGNKLARVRDPRGFVVEISMANLIFLIGNTTITDGIVQGECVWAKDNDGNVLLPISTEEYQECVNPPEKEKSKKLVHIKDVKIGDLCETRFGKNMVYCGKAKIIGHVRQGSERTKDFSSIPQYIYFDKENKRYQLFDKNQTTFVLSSGNSHEIVLNDSSYTFYLKHYRWRDDIKTVLDHGFSQYRKINSGIWGRDYEKHPDPIEFVATKVEYL